ncbi:MAG: rRNA maturation RNase YbeY [Bacteroidales bacterium]|nr:rRNA maturation RNase YbeY [Bacteroidales bacterium]MBO5819242.1 rRNA maturation RNase YbeY [Bacteroidales bacterium]MBO5834610.1 rRNA maturation RNase YbeY [Bacteroidales bacterium]MBO5846710.1 rRNA maturation RNase YbeY [Bacteroidales bacterium]MBO5915822.1 rRNA maturation RNase YbeY [Bacteroidales bacterium]
MIQYHANDIDMPQLDTTLMSRWLKQLAAFHRRKLGDINYIFCSDKKILEVNIEYLGHDYYTDIITFDYDEGLRVSGDLFISLETVASNAEMLGIAYEEELMRVMAHGVLHLCGFKDKSDEDAANMRLREQEALAILNELKN